MSTKGLREARARVVAAANALNDNVPRGRQMSAENALKFDQLMAEADVLKVRIDREDRLNGALVETKQDDATARAFRNYLALGDGISPEDKKVLAARSVKIENSMGVSTGSGGGFTVPEAFYSEIISAQMAYGGMLEAGCTILSTPTGNNLAIPTDNDTANRGFIIGENTQMTPGPDVLFASTMLGSYTYSSKPITFSIQLAQDSYFDIEALLGGMLGTRIARRVNADLTSGDGVGKPKGISNTATQGAVCATGETISFIYDDLVNLEHSVDPAYRRNAKFMFHDQGLKALKKIKDNYGRPIWLAGLTQGAPDTILGYPYVINQDMPVPAAGANSIMFGDFSRYFIRRVTGPVLVRLNERYADQGQVGVILFQRWDGRQSDPSAIKYLTNSAS